MFHINFLQSPYTVKKNPLWKALCPPPPSPPPTKACPAGVKCVFDKVKQLSASPDNPHAYLDLSCMLRGCLSANQSIPNGMQS